MRRRDTSFTVLRIIVAGAAIDRGLTPQELAKVSGLKALRVSRAVARLVGLMYVRRGYGPSLAARVYLTEYGFRAFISRAAEPEVNFLKRACRDGCGVLTWEWGCPPPKGEKLK